MSSPPRAFSANLGKLEGEQRSQQVVGNTRLLAPSDFITPWRTSPGVRELPASTLKSLTEAKHHMDMTQEKIKHIVREEIITSPERFRQGRMKLGSNKTSPSAVTGDIVLTELPTQPQELGHVEFADSRNVTLHRADGRRLQLPLAACTVTTPTSLNSQMECQRGGGMGTIQI